MLSVVRTRRETEAVCLTTTQVGVRVAGSPVMEEKKAPFVSLHMSRASKEVCERKLKEKAMWPFYKVGLRMRFLGRNRTTPTHACFTCIHPDHILVL